MDPLHSQPSQESHDENCFLAMGGGGLCNCSLSKDPAEAGLPAEPSEGKKDLEPVREDAHRSPSGSEFRLLLPGEVIQPGDETQSWDGKSWEPIHDRDIVCGQFYDPESQHLQMRTRRPLPAAEGEALPEAPAEGSPSPFLAMREARTNLHARGFTETQIDDVMDVIITLGWRPAKLEGR